jgi:hypothetical protein
MKKVHFSFFAVFELQSWKIVNPRLEHMEFHTAQSLSLNQSVLLKVNSIFQVLNTSPALSPQKIFSVEVNKALAAPQKTSKFCSWTMFLWEQKTGADLSFKIER